MVHSSTMILIATLQGEDGLQVRLAQIVGRSDYLKPTCMQGLPWCPGWAPWSHTAFTNDIVLVRLAQPATFTRKIAPIPIMEEEVKPGEQ